VAVAIVATLLIDDIHLEDSQGPLAGEQVAESLRKRFRQDNNRDLPVANRID
jgi:hypothetical protein